MGETGVVKSRIWPTPKISDRGTLLMMVGYNHNSEADGYRMWYPGNNMVHLKRDTIWSKKMYHETTKQGAKIINSEANVRKIKV